MANLPPQFYKDMSGGMVTNVNKNLTPPNTVALGLNVDFDEEIGSAVTRLGTGIIGSQLVAGMRVLGLHDFRDSDGANHALLATVNASGGATSVVYKVGTGTIRTGLTASKKMRFVSFLDSVLAQRRWRPARIHRGGWRQPGPLRQARSIGDGIP